MLDLLGAMADRPHGSYVALMRPIMLASALAYNTTNPDSDFDHMKKQTTGDFDYMSNFGQITNYRRDYSLELNPPSFGIHARVFVKDDEERIIVALRGSCHDSAHRQCRADNCYLARADNFGFYTDEVVTRWAGRCTEFKEQELDYLGQSRDLVQKIQSTYPYYAVLLTGHSMGGNLAILTAAQQPDKLQALAITPSPFHRIMMYELKFSADRVNMLPTDNLISFGDAYDLGINTALVSDAREGSITCVIHNTGKPPDPCDKLVNDMAKGASLTSSSEWSTTTQCKHAAHSISRYTDLLNQEVPILPICHKELSTLAGWNVKVDFDSAGMGLDSSSKSFGEKLNEILLDSDGTPLGSPTE